VDSEVQTSLSLYVKENNIFFYCNNNIFMLLSLIDSATLCRGKRQKKTKQEDEKTKNGQPYGGHSVWGIHGICCWIHG